MQDKDTELLSEAYYKVLSENLPAEGSEAQNASVDLLTSHGYKFDNWISGSIEGTQAALLSKKPNRFSTHYAEVEADGSINGMPAEVFMRGVVPGGNAEAESDYSDDSVHDINHFEQ